MERRSAGISHSRVEVLIDLYKTNDTYSGLGQYSLNFARELLTFRPDWLKPIFLAPASYTALPDPQVQRMRHNAFQRYIPAASPRAEIWHSLHQFPSHLPHPSSKLILTIHDLNFITGKDPEKAKKYLRRLQANVDRASAISVISEFTGKMVREHIDLKGKKMVTIHNGVHLEVTPETARPSWLPDRPFFFSLAVFKEQKNLHALIPLMNHFPNHLLVIAGNNATPYGRRLRELVAASGLEERIVLPGTVTDAEKYLLYSNCEASLFPSMAEGFGLPVIEAMMAGALVVCSNASSLPEIGGPKALYWDHYEPGYMAGVIRKGLELRDTGKDFTPADIAQYAAKFSWKECIMKFVELYGDVHSSL